MSRKTNLEDTVVSYFNTAPLPAAELMLRIASGAIKRRQGPRVIETPATRKVNAQTKRRQGEIEAENAEPRRPANATQPV